MDRRLSRILSKTKWTGAEVGKLYIESYINDFIKCAQGEKDHEPLFSQEALNQMVESLDTEKQKNTYLAYLRIQLFMMEGFNKSQTYNQQFLHGFYRYISELERTQAKEEAERALLSQPLILSKVEYDKHYKKTRDTLRNLTESPLGVIKASVEYYTERYIAGANIPAPVKEALNGIEKEPAEREEARATYNRYKRNQERAEACTPANTDSVKLASKALFMGLPWLIENTETTEAERLKLDRLQKLGGEKIESLISQLMHKGNISLHPALEPYADSIEALISVLGYNNADGKPQAIEEPTKLDILSRALSFYFPSLIWDEESKEAETIRAIFSKQGIEKALLLYDESAPSKAGYPLEEASEELARLALFREDYPTLYSAIIESISEKLPGFSSLSSAWLIADIFTRGDLADASVIDYRERTTPANTDIAETLSQEANNARYSDYIRARYNGIAIIQDKTRYGYEPPDTSSAFFRDLEDAKVMGIISQIREYLIYPAVAYMLCYNTLLDLLGKEYGIDISIVKADEESIADLMEKFNTILFLLYSATEGNAKEQAKKRRLIKQAFPPLLVEDNKPTEGAIAKVAEELARIRKRTEGHIYLEDMEQFIVPLLQSTPAYSRETLSTLSK